MKKQAFIQCELFITSFDRKEIIETSSFDGVVDEFYDDEGNPVGTGNQE